MSSPRNAISKILDSILRERNSEEVLCKLAPRSPSSEPLLPSIPGKQSYSKSAQTERIAMLQRQGIDIARLMRSDSDFDPERLQGNIENFIGFAEIPVGLAGPLRINGLHAHGDFYIPLATSEGALVASYNRGCNVISENGGATSICLTECVSRAPCFIFGNVVEAGQFVSWVLETFDSLHEIVSLTSRYARLVDLKTTITGKEVYMNFEYTTGDASGQNMVTIATDAICRHLVKDAPVKPAHWFIEGNLSGDKKATMMSFGTVRGKKVIAEVLLSKNSIKRLLNSTAEDMHRYWEISFVGGAQSGSIGSQGHFANALAALFIACGQDVACVSEASIGITRMQAQPNGDLYASVTLPNIIVGTVGGGTGLETAKTCLEMLDCYGQGKSRKFAEICGVVVLAGEISIIAALASGDFSQAHARLGRSSKNKGNA